jgi:hypothetical protein
MKKKVKTPKLDYGQKTVSTVLEVMEIANKTKYDELLIELKKIVSNPNYKYEIDRGNDTFELLSDNELFCDIACSLMSDDIKELPIFKDIKTEPEIN